MVGHPQMLKIGHRYLEYCSKPRFLTNPTSNQASVLYYAIIQLCLEYPFMIQEKGETGRWEHLEGKFNILNYRSSSHIRTIQYRHRKAALKYDRHILSSNNFESKKIFELDIHLSTRNYAPPGQTAEKPAISMVTQPACPSKCNNLDSSHRTITETI